MHDHFNESLNSVSIEQIKDREGLRDVDTLSHYFEVEILSGGLENDITIGVANPSGIGLSKRPGTMDGSIGYSSVTGKCYWKQKDIEYGGRFGSYDVIGCGVTRSGCVYFVHNGLVLPLVQTYLRGDIFPTVSLRGKGSAVKISYGRDQPQQPYTFYSDLEKIYQNPKESINMNIRELASIKRSFRKSIGKSILQGQSSSRKDQSSSSF